MGAAAPAAGAPTGRWAGRELASQSSSATVRVTLHGDRRAVPRSFFGVSVEADEISGFEDSAGVFARFLHLVRPRDGSHMLLRIGGKSTDAAYWKVTPVGTPPWVFELGDQWLGRLATFVRREDLRVMLDLNLPVHSPTMGTAFARAVARALPRGYLVGLGIGNEPDLYHDHTDLESERIATTLRSTPPNWAERYSPSRYRSDYRAYARALRRVTPHVPLVGPDTTSSTPSWVSALSRLTRAGPSEITMHRYAFSTCYPRGSPVYPTIAGLLGQGASAGIAGRLHDALRIAARAGLPLRVTELNSISCGGNEGVADSFATALWAPDALFELMRAGVAGVNWHIRPQLLNAPFHFVPGGIDPQPELYGLAIFNEMFGRGSELEKVRLSNPRKLALKAWAVRSGRVLKLLLVNKGRSMARVELPASRLSGAPARIEFLKAPSPRAKTGVTLGGRTIGSDARWHGAAVTATVRRAGGFYRFRVRRYSAEIIRLTI